MINQRIEERQKKFKEALLAVLGEMPIIEVAVKRAGVSRDTYYRWQREDKKFLQQSNEALSQGLEFINDMSESQLITLIKEKKMPAIAMWLKHNHVRYNGKIKEKESEGNSAEPMTPEQQALVEKALSLANIKEWDKKNEWPIT